MRRKPYFLKLLAFSLFLATIPVIAQGIFSYHKASGMIQDKVLESNRLILQQSQTHAEQILKSIESTMLNYVNSSELLNSMQSPVEPSLFPMFTRLNRAVSSMNFYEYGVKRAYLVNLKNNWVLDGEGVYHLDEIDDPRKYTGLLEKMSSPSGWFINQDYLPNTAMNRNRRAGDSIVLVQKIPQYSTRPVGLAMVEFPSKALGQMIGNSDKLGMFLIIDQHDRVVADSPSPRSGPVLNREPIVRKIDALPDANGFDTVSMEGQEVGFTYIRSTYNNWTYLSIMPFEHITRDSRSIGWMALIIGASMLLFILVLALVGTRKMYRPIARIYESAVESIPHDRGDELELIRQQFLQLRSSQFAMRDQLNVQYMQLKDFFLQKLFRGELSREDAEEQARTFRIGEGWRRLSVFAVQIDALDPARFRENDRDLLMFAINNIIRELLSEENRSESVLIDKCQVTLLQHAGENEDAVKKKMYRIGELVQQTIKRYLRIPVSIGISNPYSRITNTSRAFEEALEALRYRIKYGEESILYLEDVQPDEEDNTAPAFPKTLEIDLIHAIGIGDRKAVEQKFDEFLEWLLSQDVGYREQQVYLARILIDVLKVVQDMRIHPKSLLEKESSVFTQLFDLNTADELKRWFVDEIVEEIAVLLENRRELKYVKVAEELVAIIKEQFDTDLSLELCAERLGVHPSYLKRVLRRELGTSFSEYLSRYRLQKAKEYLLQTDLKIADIADRLRYNNPQNFIRYFRKMEGVTPGEYRRRKTGVVANGCSG